MKVKAFSFRLSNPASHAFDDDFKSAWYKNQISLVQTTEDIENTINEFIEDKTVVQMIVTHVDVNYHNNARGNTIDLIYTIMYE